MPRTILIADDSPTIRRLITQTFSDGDFRIIEVNNGDAAIKAFDENRPSVVLADIYMPGKNGYQVCSYIRSHRQLNRTPVVLLIGAFDAYDEQAANLAGATASITKPFEPAALVELITSILPPEGEEPPPEPEPALEPGEPVSEAAEAKPAPVTSDPVTSELTDESEDLLGLAAIFEGSEPASLASTISVQVIDRIADRVIHRLSTQVIESIAWEVVPDIAEKIVREEVKRIHES
jgi:CheY-like chemotaxis protein